MKTEEMRKKIDAWFEANRDDMVRDLGRLIAVRSVAGTPAPGMPFGPGPREALGVACDMLQERGFEVTEFEDMIITADLGEGDPALGVLAHVDVVAANDGGWESDPFEMAIRDDKLVGRGATDNKGPAVALMYAMYAARDIAPALSKRCRLILGSGEELGCGDVKRYLEKVKMPPSVFTPDADFPVVNVEKGRFVTYFEARWDEDKRLPRVLSITGGGTENIVPGTASAVVEGVTVGDAERICREYSAKTGAEITCADHGGGTVMITATGRATHAAHPESGNNAQTALLETVCALPLTDSVSHARLAALTRLYPHGDSAGTALGINCADDIAGALTLNFGVLEYTTAGLSGNFDSRTPGVADARDLAGEVKAALEREGFTVTDSSRTLSHHTPGDSAFVRTLLRIYEDYTGNPGECLAMGGTTYAHGIPGGVAFGCEMEGVANLIHGANEFIGIDQLLISAKMFTMAIIDICG